MHLHNYGFSRGFKERAKVICKNGCWTFNASYGKVVELNYNCFSPLRLAHISDKSTSLFDSRAQIRHRYLHGDFGVAQSNLMFSIMSAIDATLKPRDSRL